jgi:hypothetical protein
VCRCEDQNIFSFSDYSWPLSLLHVDDGSGDEWKKKKSATAEKSASCSINKSEITFFSVSRLETCFHLQNKREMMMMMIILAMKNGRKSEIEKKGGWKEDLKRSLMFKLEFKQLPLVLSLFLYIIFINIVAGSWKRSSWKPCAIV